MAAHRETLGNTPPMPRIGSASVAPHWPCQVFRNDMPFASGLLRSTLSFRALYSMGWLVEARTIRGLRSTPVMRMRAVILVERCAETRASIRRRWSWRTRNWASSSGTSSCCRVTAVLQTKLVAHGMDPTLAIFFERARVAGGASEGDSVQWAMRSSSSTTACCTVAEQISTESAKQASTVPNTVSPPGWRVARRASLSQFFEAWRMLHMSPPADAAVLAPTDASEDAQLAPEPVRSEAADQI